MPHRTTSFGSTSGAPYAPWLVSLVMWMNCMQYIPRTGVTVRELYHLSHVSKKNLRTILTGMQRWGYLRIESSSAVKGVRSPGSASVQLTSAGGKAQALCRLLVPEIEERWRRRCGEDEIAQLRKALSAVLEYFDYQLPQGMPIVGYGLVSGTPDKAFAKSGECDISSISLPALVAGVLTIFAVEFERESPVSLAIGANVLRVLDSNRVPVKELPRMSAISKEAVDMSLKFLQKRGYVLVETNSSDRIRIARLTAKGVTAQKQYWELAWTIEKRWRERFGAARVNSLRHTLEQLAGDRDGSRLLRGITSYANGWRAKTKSYGLPHFPVVTHRGGFPDGS
ncbi:MAG TPA: hypothetical protein VFA90_03405 [Terriglobales bacterium]|nr:hypothetical protein [Terriglobales bacterium]